MRSAEGRSKRGVEHGEEREHSEKVLLNGLTDGGILPHTILLRHDRTRRGEIQILNGTNGNGRCGRRERDFAWPASFSLFRYRTRDGRNTWRCRLGSLLLLWRLDNFGPFPCAALLVFGITVVPVAVFFVAPCCCILSFNLVLLFTAKLLPPFSIPFLEQRWTTDQTSDKRPKAVLFALQSRFTFLKNTRTRKLSHLRPHAHRNDIPNVLCGLAEDVRFAHLSGNLDTINKPSRVNDIVIRR